jgi:hypothetical protein
MAHVAHSRRLVYICCRRKYWNGVAHFTHEKVGHGGAWEDCAQEQVRRPPARRLRSRTREFAVRRRPRNPAPSARNSTIRAGFCSPALSWLNLRVTRGAPLSAGRRAREQIHGPPGPEGQGKPRGEEAVLELPRPRERLEGERGKAEERETSQQFG